VARDWFLQAKYQYAMSDLRTVLPTIPALPGFDRTTESWGNLGELKLSATWQLPNGYFTRAATSPSA
jgi:hypothetical protein